MVVTVACWAFTANTEEMSSVVGEATLCQCLPALVVRRMAPVRPTIQHTLLDEAEPASKSAMMPVFCNNQCDPESMECSTIPEEPRRHVVELSEDETATEF